MQIARLIQAQKNDHVIFTSGGTESANWAIWGTVEAAHQRANSINKDNVLPHVITSAVEHPCVINMCKHLATTHRCSLTIVPVDLEGRVSVEDVVSSLRPETCLITIMHANNEVGTVQPIEDIARALKENVPPGLGPLFHTDASQSVGKIPVDVNVLGVDLLTIAGHKLYAPKGIGVLFMRSDVPAKIGRRFPNFMHGGGQESGRRPGTENVALIAGLGAGAELVSGPSASTDHAKYEKLTRSMLHQLRTRCTGTVRMNGPANPDPVVILATGGRQVWARLPNTLSVSFAGLHSAEMLKSMSGRLACSAAAACHTGHVADSVSQVLLAMGLDIMYARGTLRLSVGKYTTESEVITAARIISETANALWAQRSGGRYAGLSVNRANGHGEVNKTPKNYNVLDDRQSEGVHISSGAQQRNAPSLPPPPPPPPPPRHSITKPTKMQVKKPWGARQPPTKKYARASQQFRGNQSRLRSSRTAPKAMSVPRYMQNTVSNERRVSLVSVAKHDLPDDTQQEVEISAEERPISGNEEGSWEEAGQETGQIPRQIIEDYGLPQQMAFSSPLQEGVTRSPPARIRLSLKKDMQSNMVYSASSRRDYNAEGIGSNDWKSDFDRVLARTRAALMKSPAIATQKTASHIFEQAPANMFMQAAAPASNIIPVPQPKAMGSPTDEKALAAFEQIDTNQDGHIDKGEFLKAVHTAETLRAMSSSTVYSPSTSTAENTLDAAIARVRRDINDLENL